MFSIVDPTLWYLLVTVLGWLTFPLAYRFLPALADRGYAVSRALGLLLWGYIFWLLASLGLLRNNVGGLLFAMALLVALSAWAWRGIDRDEFTAWLKSQSLQILVVEMLFLIAFTTWSLVRAANPEAAYTEKPMELAFINAILASPAFPPHDPWLSGYAISYYYFGYVIVAMLAKFVGTSGGVAFNLGGILVFALSAIGAYGLVYNLLEAFYRSRRPDSPPAAAWATLNALLGPFFVLIVSNLEGFLDVLHARGLFWPTDPSGALAQTAPFWKWLDILELNTPPAQPTSWIAERSWWWWRASRVVQDYDLAHNAKEIIDEFPFFSYLLADLHPHVLAMPFAFLIMSLALNVFLGGIRGQITRLQWRLNFRTLAWLGLLALPVGTTLLGIGLLSLKLPLIALGFLLLVLGAFFIMVFRHLLIEHSLAVLVRSDLPVFSTGSEYTLGQAFDIHPASFLLAAVVLGGMAFLNTWDFPFDVALFAAAYALRQAIAGQKGFIQALKDFFWLALALGIAGGLLYLPFYLGFSSQAGGILPNLIYPTRGAQLWVMFAPLLLPILAYLLYLTFLKRDFKSLWNGLKLATGLSILLWILSLLLGLAIVIIPQLGEFYLKTLAAPDSLTLFQQAIRRRFESPGGWITLLALLSLTLGLLLQPGKKEKASEDQLSTHYFALLLILFGTLFVLGPEFFYLRDQFGWRINTIFKFYYQAWLMWGIAAAYGTALLLGNPRRFTGLVFRIGLTLIVLASLVYPIIGLSKKTNDFQPSQWTLDGAAYLNIQSPDDMAAIHWLQSAPPGVVAEAVPDGGGSYTSSARVSMLSGMPAVLGWVGHELQWRGSGQPLGNRQADLQLLYCGRNWEETQAILQKYQVRYIFVGTLERTTYLPKADICPAGLVESKFTRSLKIAFHQGSATIYEYIDPNSTQ